MIINQIVKIDVWWIVMNIKQGWHITVLSRRRNQFQRSHHNSFQFWSSSSCCCSWLLICVCDGRLSLGDWLVRRRSCSAFLCFLMNMGCLWPICSGKMIAGWKDFDLWTARHMKADCLGSYFHCDLFQLQSSDALASDSSADNCWESILPGNNWWARFDSNWEIDFFAQNPAHS